jgi:two-component system response regulator YesN
MYTMMIADDEALERRALRGVTETRFPGIFRICEASNGAVALQLAKTERPDILLMDIKMPRMSGIEVAREVKSFLPECVIVLISGYTYFNYAREAVAIGIRDFLVKPVENDALANAVQSAIDTLEDRRRSRTDTGKLARLSLCLEREFVSSLALRQIQEPHLSEYLENLGIKGMSGLGFMLMPNGRGKPVSEMQEIEARKTANECFDGGRVLLAGAFGQLYGILFCPESWPRPALQELFERFLSALEPSFGVGLSIYAGSLKSACTQLFESFNEARRLVGTERHAVLLAAPGEELSGEIPLDLEKEYLLGEKLMQGDRDACLVLVEDLYRQIERNSRTFSELKGRVTNLLVVMGRRLARGMISIDCLAFRDQVEALAQAAEVKSYLFEQLQQMLEQVAVHFDRNSKEWKSRITDYLSSHFRQETTLEELASLVGFSTSYLSRIFKKEFGMNFCSYVNHLRIEEAKRLLAAGDLSIKEIAYWLGYSDANYFARVFRKETGTNASQYQREKTS